MTLSMRVATPLVLATVLSSRAWAQAPGTDLPPGLFKEPAVMEKGMAKLEERLDRDTAPGQDPLEPSKDGISATTGQMITGAGIAAGPSYRHHVFNRRAVVSAMGALSVRLYTTAQVALEFPYLANGRLKVGVQSHFQDALRVSYFGLGNEARLEDRTGYRLTTSDTGGYVIAGPQTLRVTGRLAYLRPSDISPMAGPDADFPNTVDIFDEAQAPGVASPRRSYVHGDVTVATDTRNSESYPRRGGLYLATWSAFGDTTGNRGNFQRFEFDGAQFVPVLQERVVLAARATFAATRVPDGNTVPIFLLPSVGGRNARGYADYQFHDRALQTYSVESRVAVLRHVDAAVFADFAGVAASVGDLSRGGLKSSYGAGVRFHSARTMLGRIDFGHGPDGWRMFFSVNDSFRRSRQVAGRPPVVPYVP